MMRGYSKQYICVLPEPNTSIHSIDCNRPAVAVEIFFLQWQVGWLWQVYQLSITANSQASLRQSSQPIIRTGSV